MITERTPHLCNLWWGRISDTSFVNIFSHRVGCLFILLDSFHAQKCFNLIQSLLLIFFFVSIVWRDILRKKLLVPMFSSGSFII